jgi:DNA replication protein DnaC
LDHAIGWKRVHGNLVLLGPTGIGKTACAHAIVHRIVTMSLHEPERLKRDDWQFAERLRWYEASTIALARRHKRLGRGEADVVEEARNASLLVINEFGFGPSSDAGDGTLFDVIDARYGAGAPTIVTSGCREAEIVERHGAAFMRRLRDRGLIFSAYPGAQIELAADKMGPTK